MSYSYKPRGICAREITFDIENGILKNVKFLNGCDGNSKGLSALVENMPADEVVKRLQGISCESRSTSCPDQLARAIKEAL